MGVRAVFGGCGVGVDWRVLCAWAFVRGGFADQA